MVRPGLPHACPQVVGFVTHCDCQCQGVTRPRLQFSLFSLSLSATTPSPAPILYTTPAPATSLSLVLTARRRRRRLKRLFDLLPTYRHPQSDSFALWFFKRHAFAVRLPSTGFAPIDFVSSRPHLRLPPLFHSFHLSRSALSGLRFVVTSRQQASASPAASFS